MTVDREAEIDSALEEWDRKNREAEGESAVSAQLLIGMADTGWPAIISQQTGIPLEELKEYQNL